MSNMCNICALIKIYLPITASTNTLVIYPVLIKWPYRKAIILWWENAIIYNWELPTKMFPGYAALCTVKCFFLKKIFLN